MGVEIIAEPKQSAREEMERACLKGFQEKYPDEGYCFCETLGIGHDTFILRTDKDSYIVRYNRQLKRFMRDQPSSVSPAKPGITAIGISVFAWVFLIGSIIASFSLSGNMSAYAFIYILAVVLMGILSSLLLFGISSIVSTLKKIEAWMGGCYSELSARGKAARQSVQWPEE